MAKKLYEEANISAIASAIRSKNGFSSTYTVSEMASAIADIHPVLLSLNVSENGSYTPGTGIDGFDQVVVSIPAPVLESLTATMNSTYVPSSGVTGFSQVVVSVPTVAVALDSSAFTENGTYSASTYGLDGFNVVTISVAASSVAPVLESLEVSSNGTFTPGDGVDGFSEVVVSVPTGGGGNSDALAVLFGASSGSVYDSQVSIVREYACTSNSYITGIEFPAASGIRAYAFFSCINMLTASFASCAFINSNAFSWCSKLTSIYFPVCISIYGYAFAYCGSLESAIFPSCTSIWEKAFAGCSKLAVASFPVCTRLGESAFSDCTELETIFFPACSLLDRYCFSNCTKLAAVSLPLCETISGYAFYSCKKLSSVYLPICSLVSDGAFSYCSSLMTIILLSSSIVSLPGGANNTFGGTPIKNSALTGAFGSIYVPESLVDSYKAHSKWTAVSDRITAYIE